LGRKQLIAKRARPQGERSSKLLVPELRQVDLPGRDRLSETLTPRKLKRLGKRYPPDRPVSPVGSTEVAHALSAPLGAPLGGPPHAHACAAPPRAAAISAS